MKSQTKKLLEDFNVNNEWYVLTKLVHIKIKCKDRVRIETNSQELYEFVVRVDYDLQLLN